MEARLTQFELDSIVKSIRDYDSQCKIFLYGSRTDCSAKGGDIDLLVESEVLKFSEKIKILTDIKSKIGDQKIDLTILTAQALSEDLFFKEVIKISLT